MSIATKIQSIKNHLSSIFTLCETHGVPHAENQNLINLENNLAYYFDHTPMPKNYTIIDYAIATGTQYINTGIKMKNNIAVELKFKLDELTNGVYLGGCLITTGEKYAAILNVKENNFECSTALDSTYELQAADTNIHTLTYNSYGRRLLFDDMQKTFIRNIEDSEIKKDLLIFTLDESFNERPSGKIYSCKIYDNLTGDILRFFIPVIDNNDTVCLYDVVTQEFYYSLGDEDFY